MQAERITAQRAWGHLPACQKKVGEVVRERGIYLDPWDFGLASGRMEVPGPELERCRRSQPGRGGAAGAQFVAC